nr:MAG TPA: hypothetical protein [Caudoviricetes sp.]
MQCYHLFLKATIYALVALLQLVVLGDSDVYALC